MSQRVNLRWGDKSRQFHEIYRDMYGSNSILYDKSVLCIGLELFPPGRTKGLKRVSAYKVLDVAHPQPMTNCRSTLMTTSRTNPRANYPVLSWLWVLIKLKRCGT